ncbi:hypothetical protein BX666DRAFT_2081374 [Dichotomocladium elegans]|nr:hypothetical protein BX666DRAFT_2081374 [Dichotomocladium elegans]
MHLLGSNVGPHLWTMLTNPVSESPFLLSNAQKTLVSTSLRRTKPTWPSVFDGKIKDVLTRTSDTRAVDYIDMLIYFIPTAVLEVLEEEGGCSDRGAIALASLIKACAISLSWEITDEDISAVERCINTWQGFALDEVPGNLHTINMHYLRHLPEALRQFGPLRTVSARSMERTVGLYDKRIRSTKAPGKNAGNQMLHISAQRHYYRITKHGYPYGEGTLGSSDGRLYVCDVSAIDCVVGVIPSPTKAKRYYYVYHGMHRNPIEVVCGSYPLFGLSNLTYSVIHENHHISGKTL